MTPPPSLRSLVIAHQRRRLAGPRGVPHCFGCNFTSSDSIPLIFDANSSATTFSEPMVAFRKAEDGLCQNEKSS